ncbi:MAG: response regulator [Saprospiraceae bacterium]|nr:response regulator [Saprospiraceae bacterium]
MDSILIVDDNRQVLEQLRELLTSEGYQVAFIPQGDFLFQRLDNGNFDLLLLDINLPGRSGIEWLREVKSHPAYQDLPVIMITGEDERSTLAQCFDLGANDYIHKPINEVALKARIRTSISARRFHQQQLELEKQKTLQSRMMMLSAQMNPHFIFNALTSVQYYLFENDTASALNFCSEFAGLMRKTLDNSSKHFITVSEELTFLENYLNLEKERFQGRFEYLITNKLEEPGSTNIPPMLLQPYLENAIVHGFQNLGRQGKIELELSEKNGTVTAIIRDNGIGRKAAAHRRPASSHRSVAMSNTKVRLELLKSVYPEDNFDVTVKDLEKNSEALGTEICIRFAGDLH